MVVKKNSLVFLMASFAALMSSAAVIPQTLRPYSAKIGAVLSERMCSIQTGVRIASPCPWVMS